MEIERKFLLKDTAKILEKFSNEDIQFEVSFIKQFYTQITELLEVRYRKSDDKYYYTTKKGNQLIREELEFEISKKEFKRAKKSRISQYILKNRYKFSLQGIEYSLDIYVGHLFGLGILEVEFNNVDEAKEFKLNSFFDEVEMKEVTEDKRYKNKNLSLWGDPNFVFNFNKSFLIIQKNFKSSIVFPENLDSYDGFRLLLNRYFSKIKFLIKKYKKNNKFKHLKQIKFYLEKILNLLLISKELFCVDIVEKIIEKLEIILTKVDEKYCIETFIRYIQNQDDSKKCVDSLVFLNNNYNLNEFFNSSDFFEFFMDFKALLISGCFYKNSDISLKKFISLEMDKQASEYIKSFENLSIEDENSKFVKNQETVLLFLTLIREFYNLYDLNILKKSSKKINKFNKLLQKLKLKENWCATIDLFDKGEVSELFKMYREDIFIQMFELRNKILKEKQKNIKNLNQIIKLMKIYH